MTGLDRVETVATRPLGILAALPEELGDLIAAMRAEGAMRTVTLGRRDYHVGTVHGAACIVTLARVGKVAAAATVSALIHVFGVSGVVFTGVAGGVSRTVRVGDVVSPQSTEVLFEILPERPRIVRAELNESYVDKVRPGMEAEVVRDNDSGPAVRARVLRVGDVFGPSRLADDPEERAGSRDVECVLALEGGDFRIGQRVLVRFRR